MHLRTLACVRLPQLELRRFSDCDAVSAGLTSASWDVDPKSDLSTCKSAMTKLVPELKNKFDGYTLVSNRCSMCSR